MSKNDVKNHTCTLSKDDLKDLVKTYRIPLDLHPCFPDHGFTMDHLPGDWFSFSKHRNAENVCIDDGPSSLKKWKDKFFLIDRRAIPDYLTWRHSCSCVSDDFPTDGYDQNDVEWLCARLICLREMREEVLVRSGLSSVWFKMNIYDFMTLPSWGDAKVAEESYHLSSLQLERVPSYTTAQAAKGAMIPFPTPDEIVASLPIPRLAKKSKGPSQLGQAEGTTVSDHAGKSGAEVMWHQKDPLDILARSALARDVEYDQILEDDFGTATRGKEIDLTLFPLTFGPYQMSYPYEGAYSPPYTKDEQDGPHAPEDNVLCKDIFKDPDVCRKALDQTITPAELRRTESLISLDLLNCFNVLSALLVAYGAELNSCYTSLVTSRNRLQEKFDQKAGYVKILRSEVTTLDGELERMQKDYDALGQENRELRSQKDVASDKVKELQTELTDARVASIGLSEELSKTDAKLSNQALVVRDLQNQLALEKAKSQGYKDVVDGLRDEVTWFIGSGVESLVRKLLSSVEFHVAHAYVASLGINYGIERGLRMGRTDVEFEVASQKVSNFHVGAKADFDKALVDFPSTSFPFLGKIIAVAGGTLPEVTQVLPDKHIRSVTSVPVAPPIANEDANQVPLEHAFDDSAASI
ncbi:hypothetical protein Tco_0880064 [Tanacetum coccineum]